MRPVNSQGPSEQKPIKHFGEKERGHIQRATAQFFWIGLPPIISGTGN